MAPGLGKPPASRPPFTLEDIKNAIPKELFRRSLARGLAYIAVDLMELALVFAFGYYVCLNTHGLLEQLFVWSVYQVWASGVLLGLWVIGHETGHGALCDSIAINDAVGFVIHTALFCPYFAWQRSHRKHHRATNHIRDDDTYVPFQKEESDPAVLPPVNKVTNFLQAVYMITVGWYLYISINASGPKYPDKPFTSHFDPNAYIFRKKDYWWVVFTDVGLVAWIATLVWIGSVVGAGNLSLFFLIPVFNMYILIILITYLQHTDEEVYHYDDKEWTWLRGALSTIDRSMGVWLDFKSHHVTTSHTVHHLFPTMPFYNAVQAKPYVKEVVGEYYCDRTYTGWWGFIFGYWETHKVCRKVEGEGVLDWMKTEDMPGYKQD